MTKQHNAHVNARAQHFLYVLWCALNIDNINGVSDWFALGDELR
jgi:hypothetical protein